MGLLGKAKEFKTQLYFKDDQKFKFTQRHLEYSCLLEKDGKEMRRGWKHFYGSQLYFPGYMGIAADTITLGFARDIILDPFNKIPIGNSVSDKPKAGDDTSLKKWNAKIAENQRHIYRTERKSTLKEDIVNYSLMIVLGIMTLAWLIGFMRTMYA